MNAKVLVVDDERDMLELLDIHFRAQGYEVRTAVTGMQALNEARRFLPDLIVLDVMLGELDGLSVCEILRVQPSTSDVPVIVITAMGGSIPRLHALGAGANDYLSKPFSPRELMERAGKIIETRMASQQRERETAEDPALGHRF